MSNRPQAASKSCILRCTGKYAIILLSIHICRRKGGCGCGVQYGGISVSLFPRGVSSLPAHAGTPDEERFSCNSERAVLRLRRDRLRLYALCFCRCFCRCVSCRRSYLHAGTVVRSCRSLSALCTVSRRALLCTVLRTINRSKFLLCRCCRRIIFSLSRNCRLCGILLILIQCICSLFFLS